METSHRGMKKVLCPIKSKDGEKTFWMRVGSAFVNRDGSLNVYLDANPINGKLQIRELDERDERPRRTDGDRTDGAGARPNLFDVVPRNSEPDRFADPATNDNNLPF